MLADAFSNFGKRLRLYLLVRKRNLVWMPEMYAACNVGVLIYVSGIDERVSAATGRAFIICDTNG